MICCARNFYYKIAITVDARLLKMCYMVYVNVLLNVRDVTRFYVKIDCLCVISQDVHVAKDQNVVISYLTERIAGRPGTCSIK